MRIQWHLTRLFCSTSSALHTGEDSIYALAKRRALRGCGVQVSSIAGVLSEFLKLEKVIKLEEFAPWLWGAVTN